MAISAPPENAPPPPQIGAFQVVEWNAVYGPTGGWVIRDMTPEELSVAFPPPPPPPPPTLDDHRRAVDDHVEAVARARGYNNAATLASYVNSTVAAWADEASAFIPWRDAAWVHTFTRLEGVLQGAQEPPASPAALVAELPAPPWPLA